MREGEVTVDDVKKVKDCARDISGIFSARVQGHLANIRQVSATERKCSSFSVFWWLAFKCLFLWCPVIFKTRKGFWKNITVSCLFYVFLSEVCFWILGLRPRCERQMLFSGKRKHQP